MRTIVVGYDGSDGARRALDRAVELARALSSRIVVVSAAMIPPAVDPLSPGPVLAVEPAWAAGLNAEELAERIIAEARAQLEGSGIEVEYAPRTGPADDAIIDVADSVGADLIVVGTREPGFVTRLLEGSVSEDVARRAHRDVLIVHPEHAAKQ